MPKYVALRKMSDRTGRVIEKDEQFEMDARYASHWLNNKFCISLKDLEKQDAAGKSAKAGPDDKTDTAKTGAKSATNTTTGKSGL